MFRWLHWDPRHLRERRRDMFEALADYPVYQPPHRQGPNTPRHVRRQGEEAYIRVMREHVARGEENFAYFMAHRAERLAALGHFLRKFDVTVSTDDAGLAAVSAWCPGKYGALVANLRDHATRQAFFQFMPWTNHLRGHNVIFDLGTFLGECIVARRPKLRWEFTGGASDDGSANSMGYYIKGFAGFRNSIDPHGYMYTLCANDEAGIRRGFDSKFYVNDLVGIVRDRSTR